MMMHGVAIEEADVLDEAAAGSAFGDHASLMSDEGDEEADGDDADEDEDEFDGDDGDEDDGDEDGDDGEESDADEDDDDN